MTREISAYASLAKSSAGAIVPTSNALTAGELEAALLRCFPAEAAEDWDRTGMLIGDPSMRVSKVAVALDPTVSALRSASAAGANVLLTHHPAFLDAPDLFRPADSVAQASGASVWEAIRLEVAVMSFHTALDASVAAAQMLPGLLSLVFTGDVLEQGKREGEGYGHICASSEQDREMTVAQLAARCKVAFGSEPRVRGSLAKIPRRIVTWTGSASGIERTLLEKRIDCLVCGEIKYHTALELSEAGVAVIELGHDVSERPFAAILARVAEEAGVPAEDIILLDQVPGR